MTDFDLARINRRENRRSNLLAAAVVIAGLAVGLVVVLVARMGDKDEQLIDKEAEIADLREQVYRLNWTFENQAVPFIVDHCALPHPVSECGQVVLDPTQAPPLESP